MKVIRNLRFAADGDVRGTEPPERTVNTSGRDGDAGLRISRFDRRTESERMNARIRPAASGDRTGKAEAVRDGICQSALNRRLVRLRLIAAVGRTVVSDFQ